MARFFWGFGAASLLWAAAAFGLYSTNLLALGRAEQADPADVVSVDASDEGNDQPDRKRGKRSRRGSRTEPRPRALGRGDNGSGAGSTETAIPHGEATIGDDLDWDGDRNVDMAGGEEQLSGKAIEAGFDAAMSRIRRCLILVPAEGDVHGKLTFGMRVGSDGTPRAVNLSGPAVVTSGESGSCLRKAAEGIRFPKFAGPDTLFKYPVTLQ